MKSNQGKKVQKFKQKWTKLLTEIFRLLHPKMESFRKKIRKFKRFEELEELARSLFQKDKQVRSNPELFKIK